MPEIRRKKTEFYTVNDSVVYPSQKKIVPYRATENVVFSAAGAYARFLDDEIFDLEKVPGLERLLRALDECSEKVSLPRGSVCFLDGRLMPGVDRQADNASDLLRIACAVLSLTFPAAKRCPHLCHPVPSLHHLFLTTRCHPIAV